MTLFPMRSLLTAAVSLSLVGGASAQLFYTFTSGPSGDGFVWDIDDPPFGVHDLPEGETFFANNDYGLTNFGNFTGNVTFFDAQYQAAGNAPQISGEAWWGNPQYGEVELSFYNTANTGIDSVSFDFAWALAGEEVAQGLSIRVRDYLGDNSGQSGYYETYVYPELTSTWNAGGAFGGFDGRSGTISISASELQDDETGTPFNVVSELFIYVGDVGTLGGTGEFAIDNVAIDGSTGGNTSHVIFTGNSGAAVFSDGTSVTNNYLRKPGTATFNSIEVFNNGTGDTTFTTYFSNVNGLTPGATETGTDVIAGTYTLTNSPLGTVNQNSASGYYSADLSVSNDQNPADPDNFITIRIGLHDAPSLSGSQAVSVSGGQQVQLANASASPGGLRAGVEITSTNITGGFAITGLTNGTKVLPGQSVSTSAISFNRFGKLSGLHNGSLTVNMNMTSQIGFFLNDAETLNRVYNLSYTLGNNNVDSENIAGGQSFGPDKIGVNNANIAATLIGGTASVAQTVNMSITTNPEAGSPSASLVGDAVNMTFSTPGNLYVLQFTYDQANLAGAGISAEDALRVLVYNTTAQDWVYAIDLNSDSGAGGAFFAGSFASFLAGPGGGSLDNADLSKFGVDAANNLAWVVLNHNSTFGLGVLGSTPLDPADLDQDGDVDDADFGIAFAAFTGPNNGPSSNPAADLDHDNDVDDADFGLAFAAFTGPGGSVNVPEPTSLVFLALGGMLATRRRR